MTETNRDYPPDLGPAAIRRTVELDGNYLVKAEHGDDRPERRVVQVESRSGCACVIVSYPCVDESERQHFLIDYLEKARQLASEVTHSFQVIAVGEYEAQPAIVLELPRCGWNPLKRVIEAHDTIEIANALKLVCHLANAIRRCHEKGLCLPGLAPDHLALADDAIELHDFGIIERFRFSFPPVMTKRDRFLPSSLGYRCPEMINETRDCDARAWDFYAFGAIAYEILTGRTPFQGTNDRILSQMADHRAIPIRQLRRECPVEVAKMIDACLELDPMQRPHDWRPVINELTRAVSSPIPSIGAATPLAKNNNVLWLDDLESRVRFLVSVACQRIGEFSQPLMNRSPLVWILAALPIICIGIGIVAMWRPNQPEKNDSTVASGLMHKAENPDSQSVAVPVKPFETLRSNRSVDFDWQVAIPEKVVLGNVFPLSDYEKCAHQPITIAELPWQKRFLPQDEARRQLPLPKIIRSGEVVCWFEMEAPEINLFSGSAELAPVRLLGIQRTENHFQRSHATDRDAPREFLGEFYAKGVWTDDTSDKASVLLSIVMDLDLAAQKFASQNKIAEAIRCQACVVSLLRRLMTYPRHFPGCCHRNTGDRGEKVTVPRLLRLAEFRLVILYIALHPDAIDEASVSDCFDHFVRGEWWDASPHDGIFIALQIAAYWSRQGASKVEREKSVKTLREICRFLCRQAARGNRTLSARLHLIWQISDRLRLLDKRWEAEAVLYVGLAMLDRERETKLEPDVLVVADWVSATINSAHSAMENRGDDQEWMRCMRCVATEFLPLLPGTYNTAPEVMKLTAALNNGSQVNKHNSFNSSLPASEAIPAHSIP